MNVHMFALIPNHVHHLCLLSRNYIIYYVMGAGMISFNKSLFHFTVLDEWEVHGQSTLHTLERRLQDILKGIEGYEVPDDENENGKENENDSRNVIGCTGKNIPAETARRLSPTTSSSSSSSSSPSSSSSYPPLEHNLIRAASGRKSSRLVDASAGTHSRCDTTSSTSIQNYKETSRNKLIPVAITVPAAVTLPSMRYLADDFTEIPFESVPHYRCEISQNGWISSFIISFVHMY